MLIILCSFTFTAKGTESHLQLSNSQCCHFDIVILRVAIISNINKMLSYRRETALQGAL